MLPATLNRVRIARSVHPRSFQFNPDHGGDRVTNQECSITESGATRVLTKKTERSLLHCLLYGLRMLLGASSLVLGSR